MDYKHSHVSALLLILFAYFLDDSSATLSEEQKTSISTYLMDVLECVDIPGLQLAVVQDNNTELNIGKFTFTRLLIYLQ